MRCLTLADAMRESGWHSIFAGRPETPLVVPALAASGHCWHPLENGRANDPISAAAAAPEDCDLLVVDNYDLDATFESQCRSWAKRIMVIDDLADRNHDCDLLLDQTLGRCESDYWSHVPKNCRLLLGPDYALLRTQFSTARRRSLERRTGNDAVKRILISFGAADAYNLTARALDGLTAAQFRGHVDVVLGKGAPHLEAVSAITETLDFPVTTHISVENMAGLMAEADLAIGAAGTTSWERCCMGLPALIVVIADNQRMIATELESAGAAVGLGWHETVNADVIARRVSDITSNGEKLFLMGERAAQICDGKGTFRLILALQKSGSARDGGPVSLRLASESDTTIMYEWQSDPRTRRHFRNQGIPTFSDHQSWVEHTLADHRCILCIILHKKNPAGVLRFDKIENLDRFTNGYEVSILIDPDKYGNRIASVALNLGRELLNRTKLYADILPGNSASRNLFMNAGYLPLSNNFYVNEPQHSAS